MGIVEYEHNGCKVKVRDDLKGLYRQHCLCHTNCANFHPEEPEKNCYIAQAVYENAVQFDIITPVMECPAYQAKEAE